MAAMKKTDKPLRPGTTRGTASTALGAKKGTKVVKITKVTKPMTKSVVRNPDAPKPATTSGSVKVITKSETAMKKGKLRGTNTTPPSKASKQTKDDNTKFTKNERSKKEYQEVKPRGSSKKGGRVNPGGPRGGMLGGGSLGGGFRGPVIK